MPGPSFFQARQMSATQFPVRKPQRLSCYDYRAGWFFVTVCTAKRLKLLGSIQGETLAPTPLGEIAASAWIQLPQQPGCAIHEFALMPDHLHGILSIERKDSPRTLGSVMGAYKSRVTRLAREMGHYSGEVWQRGYFDRVIRNERELMMTRRYVRENAMAVSLPPRIVTR